MGKQHDWSDQEKEAWATYRLPLWLRGSEADVRSNRAEIEAFLRRNGYIVEHGLIETLITCSADLIPRLKITYPQPPPSPANPLLKALDSRLEPQVPEPQKSGIWFDGRDYHSLNSSLPSHRK